MKFVVAITVFRQYELLRGAIDAIWASTRKPEKVIVFDSGGKCPDVQGAEVWRQPSHPGLAGAINRLHAEIHPGISIIQNDDLVVAPGTFEKMLKVPSPAVVKCGTFVCFREDAAIADIVGPWDEKFWPAYYEDADFAMRCKQKGINITDIGPIYLKHGNHAEWPYQHMTAPEYSLFMAQVEQNKARFVEKWKGLPSQFGL